MTCIAYHKPVSVWFIEPFIYHKLVSVWFVELFIIRNWFEFGLLNLSLSETGFSLVC